MQCTQFETRVHELLDSRQRPQDDPRLQQHAADCQDCSQFMLGQHMMLDGLSASLPSVESGSLQDVLQPEFDRLSASPVTLQHQPSFPTRRLTALLAIAASLLLVAWLLIPSGSDPVDSQLTLKPTPADSEVQSEQSQPDDIQLPDPIREFLAWDPSNNRQAGSMLLASTSSRLLKFPLPHAAIGRQMQQLWNRGAENGLPTEQIQDELLPLVQPVNTVLDSLRESFTSPLQLQKENQPDASSRCWSERIQLAAAVRLRHLSV